MGSEVQPGSFCRLFCKAPYAGGSPKLICPAGGCGIFLRKKHVAGFIWRYLKRQMKRRNMDRTICCRGTESFFLINSPFRYWVSFVVSPWQVQSNFKTVWTEPQSKEIIAMNTYISIAILALWWSHCTLIFTWAWKESCGIARSKHPNKLVDICGCLARVFQS